MKSILISIKPEFVEKILNGEKTIEIRKTKPKCELPCKVYIYCTQAKLPKQGKDCVRADHLTKPNPYLTKKEYVLGANYDECLNGKVVAEFTLNKVDTIFICDPDILLNGQQKSWNWFKNKSCLDAEQLMSYIGYGNDHDGWGRDWDTGYAWHIDNLKIYDKPKQLNKLYKQGMKSYFNKLQKEYPNIDYSCYLENYKLQRPPQSWCYVE